MLPAPDMYTTSKRHIQTTGTPFMSKNRIARVLISLFQHHMQPQAELWPAATFASIWEKAAAPKVCLLLDIALVLLCYVFNGFL